MALLAHHNLHFIQALMAAMRAAIADGSFATLRARVAATWTPRAAADAAD
jgi:tRNA-guanine family transglycosylase